MTASPKSRGGGWLQRFTAVVLAAAVLAVLSACSTVMAVRDPIRFDADHRLKIHSPPGEANVSVPVTISWTAGSFSPTDGRQFALFIDRPPIGLTKTLRLRLCGANESEPPVAGEGRTACHDDRKRIYVTTRTSITLACMDQRPSGPDNVRNIHTVSVIFLDRDWRRIGPGVATTTFTVRDDKALHDCLGLLT